MNTLARIALALAAMTTLAHAAPRKSRADSAWVKTCIHERTGPDGGIPVAEARRICRAEEPSKLEKAMERTAKRAESRRTRAAKVQERCEVALYEACVLREEARLGHDQDAGACEAIADGGKTDYAVCRTSAE